MLPFLYSLLLSWDCVLCLEGKINSERVWKKFFASNYLNLYLVTMSHQSQPMFMCSWQHSRGWELHHWCMMPTIIGQIKPKCFPDDVPKVWELLFMLHDETKVRFGRSLKKGTAVSLNKAPWGAKLEFVIFEPHSSEIALTEELCSLRKFVLLLL